MLRQGRRKAGAAPAPEPPACLPPDWALALVGGDADELHEPAGGDRVSLHLRRSPAASLCSARVTDAIDLSGQALRAATATAYRRIRTALTGGPACHPVRVWNHVPDIHAAGGSGQDRYMAFNAGRFDALCDWFGGKGEFDARVPAASCVDPGGRDLVIHCLAAARPGRAISNPRQIAPYCYSRAYGERPPCFARATLLDDPAGMLLVAGTASIVGEQSCHIGDLAAQCRETLMNMAGVVAEATGQPPAGGHAALLRRFAELRVYYPRHEDRERLHSFLAGEFSCACEIQYVRADLCRRELLVEIEGMALLNSQPTA